MKMTAHNILITGGAGFIGSNLTDRLLARGHRVICLDNFSTGRRENLLSALENPNFTLKEGDIRDSALCRELCAGVDYVFHEAALGSVPRSIADPGTVNDVNVGGFVNMLKAAADAGVKRFIYASSSSVYGDDPALPKREERIGKALSPYAVTKYADEVYADVFSRLYGLETIGLRYFNVFGRRQNPAGEYAAVIPRFAAALLEHRQPVIYGDGSQSRDFTYIDNVLSANELAMEIPALPAGRNAPVCNIACGKGVTLLELFRDLRDCLGKADPSILPIEAAFAPPRKGDIAHSLADISLAARLLGYVPLKNFSEGIALAAEWYRNSAPAFSTPAPAGE